jgi:hypothetical protein
LKSSRTAIGIRPISSRSGRSSGCQRRTGCGRTSSSPPSRRISRPAGSRKPSEDFLRRSARKKDPRVTEKSGVWYRLNRWREAEVAKRAVTYGELVDQYIALNSAGRFERIPYDCYVNFLADYLEGEKGATHKDARAAWRKLKEMEVPKNYAAWRRASR